MARIYCFSECINKSEKKFLNFIDCGLPPKNDLHLDSLDSFGLYGTEYISVANFEMPDRAAGRFLEIDQILIAPHAIYVIEVKDWGNEITGDDRTWILSGNHERANPHRTLNYKCRVIQSLLSEYHPKLRHIWVQGIVVIAREEVELNLKGQCKGLTFKLNENLIQYLKDPSRLQTPRNRPVYKNGIADLQVTACEALLGKAQFQQADKPRVIQGYEIEEELSASEEVSEYLGTKVLNGQKHGSTKRLRVFRLPNHLNNENAKKQQAQLLRDYEALEAIGSHQHIIGLKGLFDDESGQFVEVLDWSEEGSLRSVLNQRELTLDESLKIVEGIAKGLQAIHSKGIIHRALRPENILMTAQGPQIMNFDRSYLYTSQGQTVWQTITDEEELRYLPPELALSMDAYDCFESSDLYSLGAIFYELLFKDLPYANAEAFQAAGGTLVDSLLPSRRNPDIPSAVDSLIQKLYAIDPDKRYANATDVLAELEQLKQQAEAPQEISQPMSTYNPPQAGERVGDYELIQPLGSSGYFSEIYLARHYLFANKRYALKVNKRGAVDLENLIDEFNILDQLNHEHIVKVSNASQLPDGRFFLAMEYLDGQSVREQIQALQDAPLHQRLNATKTLAQQILAALRHLHEPEQKSGALKDTVLLHRDIKPENIMYVPDRGYVLVDFNIAKQVVTQSTQTFIGTKPYIPPDLVNLVKNEIQWNESADTFALGCTLFELLTGQHPYRFKPSLNQTPQPIENLIDTQEIPLAFCEFLTKSVHTVASERFQNAKAMEKAFNACFEQPQFESNVNSVSKTGLKAAFKPSPWIQFLRQYGPIARNENMYDEHIQRALKRTKMKPLEFNTEYLEELYQNFQQADPDSVILTGTAGDGKTYTCRRVWELLKGGDDGSWQAGNELPTMRLDNGKTLIVIKDLSELKNTQAQGLIERLAKAILGQNTNEVFLVAANDGQLMERWTQNRSLSSAVETVHPILEKLLVTNESSQAGYKLRLHNLSRLVRERSSYQQMFKSLLDHPGWEHCQNCPYQNNKCPIWENRVRLEGLSDNQLMQKRLVDLLELSQLNEHHLTTRQLLLLMANALLGHPDAKEHLLRCEDIPHLVDQGTLPLASIYRNLFGENLPTRKREGYDVFDALKQFGIGYETNNRLDNTLIFGRDNPEYHEDYQAWVQSDTYYGEFQAFKANQIAYIEEEVSDRQAFLDLLRDQRQRLFFVIPEVQADEANLWSLTVYRSAGTYLNLYHRLLNKEMPDSGTLRKLICGFNRVITGLPTTTQDELYLASSGCYTQATISPVWEDFIPIGPKEGKGIALLTGKNKQPQLVVQFAARPRPIREEFALPLYRFEFLWRVAQGLLPASFSNEYYKDILALKTRLLQKWQTANISEDLVDDDIFGSFPREAVLEPQFIDLEDSGNIRLLKVVAHLPKEGEW